MAKALEAHNDNDPWTRISLAALRVLTQINQSEEKITREDQETDREKNEANQNAQREAREAVLIENKRASR
jgi:hypothetical protein